MALAFGHLASDVRLGRGIAPGLDHGDDVERPIELTVAADPGRFRSPDAFAMLAGVAPIPASSGQSQRMRLNRGGDEIGAGGEEEAELGRRIDPPDRRQVRLARRDPGDREGITRVALAGPACPAPLASTELGWDLAHGVPEPLDRAGGCGTIRRGALEPEPRPGRHPAGPGGEVGVFGRVVGEARLAEDGPELVDGTRRQAVLVSVDPDRCHRLSSTPGIRWARAGRADVR